MRKLVLFILIGFGPGSAMGAQVPTTVSPGEVSKVARVEARCPTFSWTQVEGATSYELVVYRVRGEDEPTRPVLRRRFTGPVDSWTPPLDRCLTRGERYAWSVRARRGEKTSEWSPPGLFEVDPGPSPAELREALAVVRSYLAEGADAPAPPAGATRTTAAQGPGRPETTGAAGSSGAPPPTQLSVDGHVEATSYAGDGSGLAGVATDAELTAHEGNSLAHHIPPTTLPPSGAAGGDLTGTYPSPLIGPDAVGSAEIADGSVDVADLAFDPATQPELDALLAGVSCPPGQTLAGFDGSGDPLCAPVAPILSTVDGPDDVGSYPSIIIGTDGLPVMSFRDFENGDLKVAKCNDPACSPAVNGPETVSTVDSTGNVGYYNALTLGADGFPVISYYLGTNDALKVAKCNDPACDPAVNGAETVSTVEDLTPQAGNYQTSIAVGADNFPIISYYDDFNGVLKVAKCNDVACDPTVNGAEPISILDVGFRSSIALGTDGLPVVAYDYFSTGKIWVTKCNDPACSPLVNGAETAFDVDLGDGFGGMTLGTDDLPVLTYYLNVPNQLRVVKCNDPACDPAVNGAEEFSIVDDATEVGNPSIALDTDGLPVISYFDSTTKDLKVAKCNDPACDPAVNGPETISTVDFSGDVGLHNSIAVAPDGLPVVGYYDDTHNNVKVAKCSNPACVP